MLNEIPKLIASALVLALAGCAPQSSAPIAHPGQKAETRGPEVERARPARERAPVPPKAVAAPPAVCDAYRTRSVGCTTPPSALVALEQALSESDSERRDRALAALETCQEFDPGVILMLRAENAPVECGDAIVGEALPASVDPELSATLVALVHAAHLKRLVVSPPRLEPPFSKQEFAEFSRRTLNEWVVSQAKAIHEIAEHGVRLNGYARGVVAVEAGLSDMRFVSAVREVPLPEEMAHDAELAEAYFAELDIALSPWKDRGRDAALVGLKEFAEVGVLRDERVERARRLLSELYGGRRIDRLDGLLLPAASANAPAAPLERLASVLPTHLVRRVLPEFDAADPALLSALALRGLPASVRAELEHTSLGPEASLVVARALVELGQRYWRAADFRAAVSVLARPGVPDSPEASLLRGIAEVLQAGPRDAVDMMLNGVRLVGGEGSVRALDALGVSRGALAGAAMFDAAYLLELTPPQGAPEFWRMLAKRYLAASSALSDGQEKARADELGRAALDTARALGP